MKPCPLLTPKSHFVEKVWAGTRLQKLAQQNLSIGEAWLTADLDDGQTFIGEASLRELVFIYGRELVGTRAPRKDRFPLLLKLIDAGDDLSVQVHPQTTDAKKDEAWLILENSKDAVVLHGFADGVDRDRFAAAITAQNPEELLRHVVAHRGDVIRVPPGTMHAIGAGCFLLELQEPSNTTYRVWDYARLGNNGKARELHVAEALAATDFDASPPTKNERTRLDHDVELLVNTPSYRMESLQLRGPRTLVLDGTTPLLIVPLQHPLDAERQSESAALAVLQALIVPAASAPVQLRGEGEVIVCGLGGPRLTHLRSPKQAPPR